jgi:hypothetical protein
MTPAELIARSEAQPEVTVAREVSVAGPHLQAALRERRPMLMTDLLGHPDQTKQRRVFRYGHVLGPGLSQDDIASWQNGFPHQRLPLDVVDALQSVNGVHLWADLAIGRAYFGIAPLSEWTDAEGLVWQVDAGPRTSLVISYHDNGDYFLVLDTEASRYEWIDQEVIDNRIEVGRTFSEMLGWFWGYTRSLAPVGDQAG